MTTLYYASVSLRVSPGFYRGAIHLDLSPTRPSASSSWPTAARTWNIRLTWEKEPATQLIAQEFCRTTLAELRAAEAEARSTPLTAP